MPILNAKENVLVTGLPHTALGTVSQSGDLLSTLFYYNVTMCNSLTDFTNLIFSVHLCSSLLHGQRYQSITNKWRH